MTSLRPRGPARQRRDRLVGLAIGIFSAFAVTLLYVYFHSLVFHNGDFRGALFHPSPYELVARGMIFATIFGLTALLAQSQLAKEDFKCVQAEYKSLLDNIPDVTWTVDSQGKMVFVSPNIERLLDCRKREIEGSDMGFLFCGMRKDDVERMKRSFDELFSGQRLFDQEFRVQRKDGRWLWLNARSTKTYEKDGVRYANGILSDITKRKEAEMALRDSEDKYRTVVDHANEGIVVIQNRAIVFSNPKISEMTGYSKDELQNVSFESLVHEDDQARVDQGLAVRLIAKNGETLWSAITTSNLGSWRGRPAVMIFLSDVTEQKRKEEALERLRNQNELILNSLGEGICGVDSEGKTTFANPAAEHLLGWKEGELIGRALHEVIHHTKADGSPYPFDECPMGKAIHDGNVHRVDGDVFWRKDGTSFSVEYTATPIWVGTRVTGAVAAFNDVTQRKRAESKLRESNRTLQTLIENSPLAIYALDLDERVTMWNPAAEDLFGWRRDEVLGRLLPMAERKAEQRMVCKRSIGGESLCGIEMELAKKDGSRIDIDQSTAPLYDAEGEIMGMMNIASDITEKKRLEAITKHQAYHDPLTDLPNRALLDDFLKTELATAERYNEKFALLFFDLDRFKEINDTLGHAAGDELLIKVAERLKRVLRRSETLGRLGGDEFAVLARKISKPENAGLIAARIVRVIDQPWFIDDREVRVTASVGIALYPGDGNTVDILLSSADTAMYLAKEHGRNGYQFYEDVTEKEKEALQDRKRRIA